jgi:hypothetical protein
MANVRLSPSGQDLGIAAGAVANAQDAGPTLCPAAVATVVLLAAYTAGATDTRASASANVKLTKDAAPGLVTVELLIAGVVVQTMALTLAAAQEIVVPVQGAGTVVPAGSADTSVRVTSAAGDVTAGAVGISGQTY